MNLLDIGEVAARSGEPPSTLRYYEEIGLIESAGRRGLRRLYAPDVMVRLSLVALGKAAGFGLGDIGKVIGGKDGPELPRDQLRAKADDLDRQIARMTGLRDALRHATECPAPSHLECPKFQRLLAAATERNRRDARATKTGLRS
ncbi:MAG: helix-turn-helix domain-containing protein [Paracoccaceae bacterium]